MIIRNEWDQLPALPAAVLAVAVVGSDDDSTDYTRVFFISIIFISIKPQNPEKLSIF